MITERPAEGRSPGHRGTAPPATGRTGNGRDLGAVLKAYLSLTKPRIVELLLITTVPAMMLAAGGWPGLRTVLVVLIGGSLAAGAASALNCYIDRDIDQLMRRTKRRPLATHTVTPRAALTFGLTLAVVSVTLMAVLTNWLATVLTAAAIFYYDVVYTLWLKRRTPQNTFWGGICGAAPVLIGWAAVTGDVTLLPVLLFAIIFLWTPPHFWALSLFIKTDYAAAGVPMLPVVAGLRTTRRQAFLYALPMAAAAILPWPLGLTGWIYGLASVALNAVFLVLAGAMLANAATEPAGMKPEKRLFAFSIVYLFALFAALVVDARLLG